MITVKCPSALIKWGNTLTLITSTLNILQIITRLTSSFFDGGRITGGPGEKPSNQGRERTNKLNSHDVPRPGIEPGTTGVRGKLHV